MPTQDDDTIENRVYLFESLANGLLQFAAGDLTAGGAARERVLAALADLAYVSCVVADSGALEAAEVRERVAAFASGGQREASASSRGPRKGTKK